MTWLAPLLAIWGAGLSTVLAWLEYRRNRPLTHILSDCFASKGLIDVSVENRGEAAIVLRGVHVLFGKEVDASIEDPDCNKVFSLLGRKSRLVRAGENLTIVPLAARLDETPGLFRVNLVEAAQRAGGADGPAVHPLAAGGTRKTCQLRVVGVSRQRGKR